MTPAEFDRALEAYNYREACATQRAYIIRSGFAGGEVPTIEQLLGIVDEDDDIDQIRAEVIAAKLREVDHANQ